MIISLLIKICSHNPTFLQKNSSFSILQGLELCIIKLI